MIFLPDANVWVALAALEHIHHRAAVAWAAENFESPLAFCRITQLALLRLLTNPHAMANQPLSSAAAWSVMESLAREPLVSVASEPPGLMETWRDLIRRHH